MSKIGSFKIVRFAAMLIALCCLSGIDFSQGKTCPTDEASQKRAQQIWEQAMIAKGGRERILNIRTLLTFDKNLDSVGLRVFPDKLWYWKKDRKPIGLEVGTYDFSKGIAYNVQNDNYPFSYKLNNVKMEWQLTDLLGLLLETKWVKPR